MEITIDGKPATVKDVIKETIKVMFEVQKVTNSVRRRNQAMIVSALLSEADCVLKRMAEDITASQTLEEFYCKMHSN